MEIFFDKVRGRIETEYMADLQNQLALGSQSGQFNGFGCRFGNGFFDEDRFAFSKQLSAQRKVGGRRRNHVDCGYNIEKISVVIRYMILRDSLLAAFLSARFSNLGNEEIDGKMGQHPQVIGSPAPGSDLHDFHRISLSDFIAFIFRARDCARIYKKYGYEVLREDNAPEKPVKKTVVIDHRGNQRLAQEIAAVIKCRNIETSAGDKTAADITIILGMDFDGQYCQ